MATPLLNWLLVKKGDWLRPSHAKPSTGPSRLHPDRCGPYLPFPRSVVDPGGMETAVGVRGKPGRVPELVVGRSARLLVDLHAWLPGLAAVQGNAQAHVPTGRVSCRPAL